MLTQGLLLDHIQFTNEVYRHVCPADTRSFPFFWLRLLSIDKLSAQMCHAAKVCNAVLFGNSSVAGVSVCH